MKKMLLAMGTGDSTVPSPNYCGEIKLLESNY